MCPARSTAPRLRPDLEIVPVSFEGGDGLLVRDPLGLVEDPLVIRRDALALLELLDGRMTVEEIREELVRAGGGVFLSLETLEGHLSELDDFFLLDSPRFRRARAQAIQEYRMRPVREAALAGQSYPADASGLRAYLDGILDSVPEAPTPDPETICALAVPHIEIGTGRALYGAGYRAIRTLRPERVVLLGTGHGIDDGYFSLTGKDFETPLGTARADKEAVSALREAGGNSVSPHDMAHRREHSLEFQVIFLQHLFGPEIRLVPVLCSSFSRELRNASRPRGIPDVDRFIAALGKLLRPGGPQTLCVAGVDLSHIGPKFGHRDDAVSLLLDAKAHDQALIRAACGHDVEGFWAESRRVGDRYHVCGFSSLATLLEILPPSDGRCLGYEFWQEGPTRSAVSYAALLFKRR